MTPSLAATAASQWREASWGERLALALFVFVCVQAVLHRPYVILIHSLHMNLWTGLLSLAALVASFLLAPGLKERLRGKTFYLSLLFLALVLASGLHSQERGIALGRGLVLWSTACGGYWCSRILLRNEPRRRLFVALCAALLGLFLLLSMTGYLLEGSVHAYFDQFRHAQVSMHFLLAFASLSLIMTRRSPQRGLGLILLAVSCFVLFLSGLRTALLMPMVLGGVGLMLGALRLRWVVLTVLLFGALLAAFFLLFPSKRLTLSHESLYYRVENYPFSLSIAQEHPWLGIGLAVPREKYFQNYTMRYPYTGREDFAYYLRQIRVSENVVLTFLDGVGIPFTLLYVGCVGFLYFLLYRATRRRSSLMGIPPLAVFLPVTAGIGHFLLYDGLLQPQVSWYFHILLAFAPVGGEIRRQEDVGRESGSP